ncbi:hypothetical protein A374_06251 [Fictibacillus macauensis ZFHKF-1]|uniref:Uncharacterized protein n=1 Tax=Fictibacillus macauensis ZFHKF-1 TaxID=1196324 RepID=I8UH84_9BACL|nr:DUF5082 family protein [Fictibacillus macauensis]EIT86178.1 hypothetical protein A374_06251 [Fictibacillus macauensis ZFHKF-1]
MLDLSPLNSQLSRNKEDILDLQRCQKKLESLQEHFTQGESKCTEPKLHKNEWSGSKADQFDKKRATLYTGYKELMKQLSGAITIIQNKISALQTSSSQLEKTIKTELVQHQQALKK